MRFKTNIVRNFKTDDNESDLTVFEPHSPHIHLLAETHHTDLQQPKTRAFSEAKYK